MQIRITKGGVLSTVQDLGRHGSRAMAVPVSGAMDGLSARLANIAVGNDPHEAVIEFTFGGAAFTAESDLLIAYAGAGACLIANSRTLPKDRPLFIPKGSPLKLMDEPAGSRTYMAIAGGWDVPVVLGSKSTYLTAGFGGFNGRALQAGDVLSGSQNLSGLSTRIIDTLQGATINYPKWYISPPNTFGSAPKVVRVIPANEFTWFNGRSIIDFLTEPYRLNLKSNRMGYHLDGPVIERLNKAELLSTAVVPGTIQVTGSGSMVLLMADCQTTGGYPRIAQVAAADMPLCAQLKPGDELYFKEISWTEAENLYIEQDKKLLLAAAAVKHKYL